MAYQYKREPLTAEEIDRLTAACRTPEERLLVFGLLDTGLRVSEFCCLTAEDVQWQQRRVVVKGKGGPFGKKSKVRVVPLSDRLRALLEPFLLVHGEIPFSERTAQRIVKRVANRAMVSRPVTPHVLRHTFAVTAIQKGISLPALQRILGHDRLATTEVYLNLSPEHVLEEFHAKW